MASPEWVLMKWSTFNTAQCTTLNTLAVLVGNEVRSRCSCTKAPTYHQLYISLNVGTGYLRMSILWAITSTNHICTEVKNGKADPSDMRQEWILFAKTRAGKTVTVFNIQLDRCHKSWKVTAVRCKLITTVQCNSYFDLVRPITNALFGTNGQQKLTQKML